MIKESHPDLVGWARRISLIAFMKLFVQISYGWFSNALKDHYFEFYTWILSLEPYLYEIVSIEF